MSSPNPTSTTSSRPGAVRGPSTTSDLSFRGDLQGLRGIAVLVVVAFHVGLAGFDGGFIGVDVFFVISGFLITRILSRQVTGRHGVALVDFWARRIRRLVPALFVVVVATLLLGLLVYSPLGWSDLAQQAGASALYVSNILFAREATIYFGTAIEASPYLHTWSLGVEEQFYLFWPFLFLGLALVLRRRSRWTIAIPAALGVVLVASFALSYVLTDRGSPWAFFSSPTRAWEFAIGGLTAVLTARASLGRTTSAVLGLAGLAALAYGVVAFDAFTPFPGTAALAPVLGTAAVLASSTPDRRSVAGAWLSWGPLQWIGTLSYSWYLWHWPLIVYAALQYPDQGLTARLVAALVSLLLAWATTVWVEDPIRFGARFTRSSAKTYLGGVALTTTAVLLAVLVVGWSNRRLEEPYLAKLASARKDRTELSSAACRGARQTNGSCVLGDPNGTKTVLLVGDSHAAHWQPALDQAGKDEGWKVVVQSYGGCPAIDVRVTIQGTHKPSTACPRFRARTADLIEEVHPDVVLVSSGDYTLRTLDRAGHLLSTDEQAAVWEDATEDYADELQAEGIPLGVLLDVPATEDDPIECAAQHDDATACAQSSDDALDLLDARHESEQHALTDAGWGAAFDPVPYFCADDTCPVEAEGIFRYVDTNHMSATFSRNLAPALEPFVADLLARQP